MAHKHSVPQLWTYTHVTHSFSQFTKSGTMNLNIQMKNRKKKRKLQSLIKKKKMTSYLSMNIVIIQTRMRIWVNPAQPKRHHIGMKVVMRAGSGSGAGAGAGLQYEKPEKCTADELHYVKVPSTDWRLALWRYLPSPPNGTTSRNHPLLMLSGLATNALGFDLSPQSSIARYMSGQGFDTWILEVRGAGLSMRGLDSFERSSKASQALAVGNGQNPTPFSFPELNEQFTPMIEDFQRELDLLLNSDWDFDQLLKDDLPKVVEYIKKQSNPQDGKLFAIGHSMGGILLYAMLSLCGFEGRDSDFAAVITLASTLDYSSSKSTFKLLLPLADPAEAINIPSIPVGALLAAILPLASRPPFLSLLKPHLSAQDTMPPELLEKLVLKNFCTVPAKLLLQLATAFESTGLSDRSGTFFYKDHLRKSNVPILALAGDRDLLCPPEAVYETVKMIPEPMITYRVFGEPGGPHYAHYDLVGGSLAVKKVYPCIIHFLSSHDKLDTPLAS